MAKQPAKSKSFGAILAVIGVVGVVAIVAVTSRPAPVITLDPSAAASLSPGGIVIGSPDAPVEVVEFADFECPGCGYFATLHAPEIKERLVATGAIRFRFMDFPLDIHRNAVAAHNAAHCANAQGKFWLMHDMLYATQERWNSQAARDPKKVRKVLIQLAASVGLDASAFTSCYDSGEMLPQIAANRREAERLRVQSTPSFKIGEKLYPGSQTYRQIRRHILAAAAEDSNPSLVALRQEQAKEDSANTTSNVALSAECETVRNFVLAQGRQRPISYEQALALALEKGCPANTIPAEWFR